MKEKMLLEKNYLKQIEKIVVASADSTKKDLRKDIVQLDAKVDRIDTKIELTKNEIITIISRKITDLANINRAVITRTDELDYRLRIVEQKLGLNVH